VIVQTLSQIARAAVGSEAVFDYPVDEAGLDEAQLRMMVAIKSVMAAAPTATTKDSIASAELMTRLKEMGFEEISVLTAAEANPYYFTDRADELRFPQLTQIVKARVGRSALRSL
jgi:hypothetical protein